MRSPNIIAPEDDDDEFKCIQPHPQRCLRCVRVMTMARNRYRRRRKKKLLSMRSDHAPVRTTVADDFFYVHTVFTHTDNQPASQSVSKKNRFQFLFEAVSFSSFSLALYSAFLSVSIWRQKENVALPEWDGMEYETKAKQIDVNNVASTTHKHSICCWCCLLRCSPLLCMHTRPNSHPNTQSRRTQTHSHTCASKVCLRMADCYYCLFFFLNS